MFCNKMIKMIAVSSAAAALLLPWPNAAAEEGGFDVSATSASSVAEKIQWHGYYEFEYWDAEGANSTFDAHKIVVWMGVPINDKVFLSSEVEYEHFPRLEDGNQKTGGSGEIKVDSAQLSITPFEGLRDYLGIFYVPFGIEYLSYPGQKNKLITRPKVMKSGGIIPGTWSDVGIGFNYKRESVGQLDVYYVNGDAKNGGISRDSSTGGNESKSLGLRVMLDGFADGVNAGFSYVTGKHDAGNRYDSTRTGIHMRVDSDRIFGNEMYPVFLFEYVIGKDKGAAGDTKKKGYYAQLSSRINPMVEVVARYGQYDNDEDAADNKKTETSIGVVLHKWDSLQIKAEFQKNDEEGPDVDNDVLAFQVVAFW